MKSPDTEADLKALIDGRVEESLTLEYKSATALSRKDRDKDEITKDVSAFANSAGGILIYGIAEGTSETKHLPVAVSPIDRREFTREWLDQICGRIQPRIDGLKITAIPLTSDDRHVVYVINVPQGETAHQASDKRYYKRSNFISSPMEDYEIRDVMNRRSHALIDVEAEIFCDITSRFSGLRLPATPGERLRPDHELRLHALNLGKAVANHVVCSVRLPSELFGIGEAHSEGTIEFNNHVPQLTGQLDGLGGARYGNPQWMPILPGLSMLLHKLRLCDDFYRRDIQKASIEWVSFCDTAPKRSGTLKFSEIKRSITEEYRRYITRLPGERR